MTFTIGPMKKVSKTLKYFSSWTSDCSWKYWRLPGHLESLLHEFSLLRNKLAGCTPIHRSIHDIRGWGRTTIYTLALGYKQLQKKKESFHYQKLWKFVWNYFGLLKVNLFTWLLFQRKILTGDNL